MLEIPEAIQLAKQSNENLAGKKIASVLVNHSPHKFAFYYEDPAFYPALLVEKTIGPAYPVSGQLEIYVEDARLLFGDSTNLRYFKPGETLPAKHQLLLTFTDGSAFTVTVQMYGGIWAYPEGANHNPYYIGAKSKPHPLSDDFSMKYFQTLYRTTKPTSSLKAFLATEQRIPGLGNGVLQDILFQARLHPKTKLQDLTEIQRNDLYWSIKNTLLQMAQQGGRNTEKDLFGANGGYHTILSNKTWKKPCPVCGGEIIRQTYLGGNIYFCPHCQPPA